MLHFPVFQFPEALNEQSSPLSAAFDLKTCVVYQIIASPHYEQRSQQASMLAVGAMLASSRVNRASHQRGSLGQELKQGEKGMVQVQNPSEVRLIPTWGRTAYRGCQSKWVEKAPDSGTHGWLAK